MVKLILLYSKIWLNLGQQKKIMVYKKSVVVLHRLLKFFEILKKSFTVQKNTFPIFEIPELILILNIHV